MRYSEVRMFQEKLFILKWEINPRSETKLQQNQKICLIVYLLVSWFLCITLTLLVQMSLSYRNQIIDLQSGANQWTGFYMIGTSIIKEVISFHERKFQECAKVILKYKLRLKHVRLRWLRKQYFLTSVIIF